MEWKIVRERSLGIFEGKIHDLCHAQLTVEEAIEDRNLLSWRVPNGESVVDLKLRVELFLDHLKNKIKEIKLNQPTILLVSHGLFLNELHNVLSTYRESGKMFIKGKIFQPNTGVSQYKIELRENDKHINHVKCLLFASGDHLEREEKQEKRI